MSYKRRQRSFNTLRMPSFEQVKKITFGILIVALVLLFSRLLYILSSKPLVIEIGQKAAMWGKTSIHQNNVTKFPSSQSVLSYIDGDEQIISDNIIIDTVLKQIPLINTLKEKILNQNATSVSNQDNITAQKEDQDEHQSATQADGDVFPIEEITISPTTSSGAVSGNKVYINNQTKFNINIDDMLKAKTPFKYNSSHMQVLIIHTHGTEGYSNAQATTYNKNDQTRTQDRQLNVIKVGDEMRKELEKLGVNVVHDTTLHDIPTFNGSYTNSLKTINTILAKYPTIKIVIDVHRDSMITAEGVKYRPVVQIDNTKAAQLMLVMGSSEGGLEYKNWQGNLAFAIKLQKRLNELYPNIMRPINLRKERYNQHATPGSLLIEVGSEANSIDQAIKSGKIFAQVVAATLKAA